MKKEIKCYVTSKKYNEFFKISKSYLIELSEDNICDIKVNKSKTFQQVIGFGGALTEAAAVNIMSLPEDKQEEVIRAYFDTESGLGYKLCRIHMNSCDFCESSYSCDDVEGDIELKHFNIERDKKMIIPLLKRIKKYCPDLKILVSPWSPPRWMKSNNDMCHGGKLKDEYKKTWAEFFCKFIESYKNEGIDIWAVTVQNEPMATQVWESCIYSAEEERDFVRDYLGPTLQAHNLGNIKILIWDHNKDIIYERAKTILSDKEAAKYIWGVAFHWYAGDHFEELSKIKKEFPKINLLFSEGCQEGGVRLGSWNLGERYAHEIIGDFNNYTVGFLDWNIALDTIGGPNHVGNFCDAPIIIDRDNKEIIFQNAYYYIGHFSKFIKPEAHIIECLNGNTNIEALAAKNDDGSIIVIIFNKNEFDVEIKLSIDNGFYKVFSPAHSIMTLIKIN